MKVGEKVLIVEEKEDRNPEDEKEDTVYGNFRESTTYLKVLCSGRVLRDTEQVIGGKF
jgi:hypothetical protein